MHSFDVATPTWTVEGTDQFSDWYWSLEPETQDAINAAIELLEERGPALGREPVGEVKSSRNHNMKELVIGASIRILFLFDPRRAAVLLLGGDKSIDGLWNEWYVEAVARADDLYDEHLAELRKEGLLPERSKKSKARMQPSERKKRRA